MEEIEKIEAQLKATREIITALSSQLADIENAPVYDEKEYETLSAKIDQLKSEETLLKQKYYQLVQEKHKLDKILR